MGLASRPGLVVQEVATWLVQFGVATWTLFWYKKKESTKILKTFLCMIKYMEYLYCNYYKCNYVVCEKKNSGV